MKSKRYYLPNKIDLAPATSHQKNYATSLGIEVPSDATKSDVQALIDLYLDDDTSAPSSLLQFATHCKVHCSSYVGNKYIYNLLFDNLVSLDQVAFFCFCVYHYLVTDGNYNLMDHPHKSIFYDFSSKYSQDFYFMESMKDYYGEELITFGKNTYILADGSIKTVYGGSQYTLAYKTATSYLKETLGLNITPIPSPSKDMASNKKTSIFSKLFNK